MCALEPSWKGMIRDIIEEEAEMSRKADIDQIVEAHTRALLLEMEREQARWDWFAEHEAEEIWEEFLEEILAVPEIRRAINMGVLIPRWEIDEEWGRLGVRAMLEIALTNRNPYISPELDDWIDEAIVGPACRALEGMGYDVCDGWQFIGWEEEEEKEPEDWDI